MATEIQCWQCEVCKTAFLTKDDAEQCEKLHSGEENLEIVEVGLYAQDERFPKKLLIGDKTYSGTLAEYAFIRQSSCECFYEQKEWGGDNE